MRKSYLDNIRWVAVVLVVIYHVFYVYNAEGVLGGLGKITGLSVQYYDLYLYAVYPWIMPLLFLVSGMSARYALDRCTEQEFLRRRTTKLLVPSTVGLLAFQFIQGYISMMLGSAFDAMTGAVPGVIRYLIMAVSGIGVLWYIQMLWLLSVLLVLIRRIEKDRLWQLGGKGRIATMLLLTVPVWATAQILNTPVIVVYRFGLYGLMFLLGYFVFSHDEVMNALKKSFSLFAVLAAVLGIAFCAVFFGENYADAPVNRSPLFTGYAWFACLAILGGMAKYGDRETGFTQWMNRRSFGLYVFHYMGISAVALWVAKPGLLPVPVVYILSLLAGFAAGYLLQALVSRLPFFRWAVLGIGKEGK